MKLLVQFNNFSEGAETRNAPLEPLRDRLVSSLIDIHPFTTTLVADHRIQHRVVAFCWSFLLPSALCLSPSSYHASPELLPRHIADGLTPTADRVLRVLRFR